MCLPRLPQVAALLNERYKVGDELKRSIRDDILRLIEAKTYRCVALTDMQSRPQPRQACLDTLTCLYVCVCTPHNAAQRRGCLYLCLKGQRVCAGLHLRGRTGIEAAGSPHSHDRSLPMLSLPSLLLLVSVRVACRGRRHVLGLPVNGQKASGNAKTARKFKRHIMYDVK